MNNDAAMRAADALLNNNGGRSVLLRVPGPAASGTSAEELGLATPSFNDIELAPAVFRKDESTALLLVSGSAVKSALGATDFEAAEALFEAALGIVVDDVLYAIEGAVGSQCEDTVYSYSMMLQAPAW